MKGKVNLPKQKALIRANMEKLKGIVYNGYTLLFLCLFLVVYDLVMKYQYFAYIIDNILYILA